jgi:hypothetical protein
MIISGSESLTLPKASSIMIVREGDKIWIHLQGKKLGFIENNDLARAVFAIFLGEQPLSEEAKAAFARGIRGAKYNL